MTWSDRIIKAAYTSPSGVRVEFDFENVKRDIDKHTAAFNFPDGNGTYVQDNGFSGYRYPVRAFFWGANCDLQANLFEAVLLESGIGTLDHPMYGIQKVIPFGTISRIDDLKEAANQSIVEVEFFTSIDGAYPEFQDDPLTAVQAALTAYNDAIAAQLAKSDLSTVSKWTTFKNQIKSGIAKVKSTMQKVADAQESIQREFDSINQSINTGLDVLIGQPLTIAYQATIMMQAPARAALDIKAKLSAYSNLLNTVIADADNFLTSDLFASGAHSGSITSVINGKFKRKTEALSAATAILTQFDTVNEWREDNTDGNDSADVYQALHQATQLVTGYLVQLSFSLDQERRIRLDRDRTIIDLVAELYGTIDDQLDFFITSNNLSGSEIIELPRGREIVYYI